MMRATEQRTLFDPVPPARVARGRRPPRQTTVTIGADAISAVMSGRTSGERVIAEAIRAARPEVRNLAVDLGTIRWTDPKTGRRVLFVTPPAVRDALLALDRGTAPAPFRFAIERAARVFRE